MMRWAFFVCTIAMLFSTTGMAHAASEVSKCDEGVGVAQRDTKASIDEYMKACLVGLPEKVARYKRSPWPAFFAPIRAAYLQRARMLQAQGRTKEALAEFDRLIKVDRDGGLAERGRFQHEIYRFKEAIADLTRAIEIQPKYDPHFIARSDVYKSIGEKARALADINRALSLDRDASNLSWRSSYWADEEGNFENAIADVNEAIALKPNNASLYLLKADILKGLRADFDGALKEINAAIGLDPRNVNAYLRRSNLWLHLKEDFDQAWADLDKANDVQANVEVVFNNRGNILILKGEYDLAITELDKSLHLYMTTVAYSNRGKAYRMKGDLDRSISDLNAAVALDPTAIIARTHRGETFRYRGEYSAALDDFSEVIRTTPDFAAAYAGRGLTYEKLGDLSRAKTDFEKALTLSEFKYDTAKDAVRTARARLDAFRSGANTPSIPAVPAKASSPNSIPTQLATTAANTPPVVADKPPGRRVALVIGNSAYTRVPALKNPQKDAEAVAASLRNIGFEKVILAADGTRERTIELLGAFANEADSADWAMVYYAGHGIEVGGQNFLVPIDAKLAADRDTQFEAISLEQVLTALEGAKKLKLILLDACRDNPFAPQMRKTPMPTISSTASVADGKVTSRSIGRGLGEVKVQGASLVVFAAKHGKTALDGDGANSPFAVAMVQRIATPGVEINKIFRLVRDDVMEATAGRQEPYTYGSLPGNEDFYFVGK